MLKYNLQTVQNSNRKQAVPLTFKMRSKYPLYLKIIWRSVKVTIKPSLNTLWMLRFIWQSYEFH